MDRNYYFFPAITGKTKITQVLEGGYYGQWSEHILSYRTIVVFDSAWQPELTEFIKTNNKKCRILVYYSNYIDNERALAILQDKNIDEFWSFDPVDAERYSLHYNPQFYSKNTLHYYQKMYQEKRDEGVIDDRYNHDANGAVVFLGRAKTREKEVQRIRRQLEEQSVKTMFIVIKEENDFVPYFNYIGWILQASAIVDIPLDGQMGLTLRVMESVYLKKKLITTNKTIVDTDLYNKNNVFILGVDNIEYIGRFLSSPYRELPVDIIEKYDFNMWLSRFFDHSL